MHAEDFNLKLNNILDVSCKKLFICIYNYKYEYIKQLQSFIQSNENYLEYFESSTNVSNRYFNYIGNWHHLTTTFIWNHVIPDICHKLQINEFNQKDFELIENYSQNQNISFHQGKFNHVFEYIGIDQNIKLTGNNHKEILRVIQSNQQTAYHRTFRGYHKNSIVNNKTINSGRKLLILNDSMMIPIIPILAYYFDEILCIDNRSNKHQSFIEEIKQFKPNYFISCFLSENYLVGRHYQFIQR